MNLRDKVMAIEHAELGYQERSDGWTKYGQWYADNIAHSQGFAKADWCAMFQTWAMNEAGLLGTIWPATSPQGSEVNYLAKWLTNKGYRTGAKDMPQAGDVVLYAWDGDASDLDHVGLCVAVNGKIADDATLTVLEGNYNNKVATRVIKYRDKRVAMTFRLPYPEIPDPEPEFPTLSFLLKQGSRSQAVELLQAALMFNGYDITGGNDGYFGSYTTAALKKYQADHGLIVDGTAGTETFRELFKK